MTRLRSVLACCVVFAACEGPSLASEVRAGEAALSTPRKVISLDAGFRPRDLAPVVIIPLDGGAVIIADEPWFSDGTTATFLGDLTPGPAATSSFSSVRGALSFEGKAWFGARHVGQRSAWVSDGTFAGTQPAFSPSRRVDAVERVAPFGLTFLEFDARNDPWLSRWRGPNEAPERFLPFDDDSNPPTPFVITAGGVLTMVNTGTRYDLVRTDGTDAGTSSLSAGRFPLREMEPPMVGFRGHAYFRSLTDDQLFRSDGSDAGPGDSLFGLTLVTDLATTSNALVVVARASSNVGPSVVFTDGTDAGTRVVMGPQGSTFLTNPRLDGVTDTHAFFHARIDSSTDALFASDGTDAGTVQLTNAALPPATADTRLAVGGRYFFTSASGQPWVSDGTTAGTVELSSTASGARGYTAISPTRVVFYARDTGGSEPWVTDGTPAGTQRLADLAPGPISSIFSNWPSPVAGYGRAWFACSTPNEGLQTCVTDGTPAGTRVATPGALFNGYTLQWLSRAGNRLLVAGAVGNVLGSDGTQAGTVALPFRATSTPPVQDSSGGAWVLSPAPPLGSALWHTDGTPDGSVLITPDGGLPSVPTLAAAGETLFVKNFDPDAGDSVLSWRRGTGFTALPDFTPEPNVSDNIRELTPVGNELAWFSYARDAGAVLVASDGTTAGTRVLGDASPLLIEYSAANLCAVGGELFFRQSLVGGTYALARARLTGGDIETLPIVIDGFTQLIGTPRSLFAIIGTTLNRIDPSAGTATVLADLGGRSIGDVRPWGDGMVLVTQRVNTIGVWDVWVTDGTAAGTRKLQTELEGRTGDGPTVSNGEEAGAEFFLAGWSRETGLEPAVLAPGADVLVPLGDVRAGPLSSSPRSPVRIGDVLYFAADDGSGQGVFAVDVTAVTPTGGGSGSTGGGSGATGGGTGATGGGDGSTGGGDGTAPTGCGCTSVEGVAIWLALWALKCRKVRARSP
jgi:ELWxxDGT repeat protein